MTDPTIPKVKDESCSKRKNAFSELMSSARKSPRNSKDSMSTGIQDAPNSIMNTQSRGALGEYIKPGIPATSLLVAFDDDFVLLHDAFPKAQVHMLLMPRDSTLTKLHPLIALNDDKTLSNVCQWANKAKDLAASELRRQFGLQSISEQARNEAMLRDPPVDPEVLPQGRDWRKELLVGIHIHPSMSNLHIHLISVDRYSDRLRHRKHYNSFSTPFFVPLDSFPMTEDKKTSLLHVNYLKQDLVCWRCLRNFGNRFSVLKDHLREEFEAWKRV